jgi:hypothetical protein
MKHSATIFFVVISLALNMTSAWAMDDGQHPPQTALEVESDAGPLMNPDPRLGISCWTRHRFAIGLSTFVLGVMSGTLGTIYALVDKRVAKTEDIVVDLTKKIDAGTVVAAKISTQVDNYGPKMTHMYDEGTQKVDNVTSIAQAMYAGISTMFASCERSFNRGIDFADTRVLPMFNETKSICLALVPQIEALQVTCATTATTCSGAVTACNACQNCNNCGRFP